MKRQQQQSFSGQRQFLRWSFLFSQSRSCWSPVGICRKKCLKKWVWRGVAWWSKPAVSMCTTYFTQAIDFGKQLLVKRKHRDVGRLNKQRERDQWTHFANHIHASGPAFAFLSVFTRAPSRATGLPRHTLICRPAVAVPYDPKDTTFSPISSTFSQVRAGQ